jgi:hypothetical protein
MSGKIYTASGRLYDVLKPDPKMIDIEDIAHQLALTNRWGGASRLPISVAQHSCLVAETVEGKKLKRLALMHDAPEAYLGDVCRPMKAVSPEYRKYEALAWEAINAKFKLGAPTLPMEIVEADRLLLAWEAELYMPKVCYQECFISYPSYPEKMEGLLAPWSWRTAESTFLARFKLLFG